jgi:transposase
LTSRMWSVWPGSRWRARRGSQGNSAVPSNHPADPCSAARALDLGALGFDGVIPEATGRPAYHPGALLKIYVYGYINQIASSRRLERETYRNVELMWLTGRLTPDFKTIADFRKDNGHLQGRVGGTCDKLVSRFNEFDRIAFPPSVRPRQPLTLAV